MILRIAKFIFVSLISISVFSQKYKKIHVKAIVVDTHNDFPSASIEKKVRFDSSLLGITHSDLARMYAGGVDVQVFSIFCGPEREQPYAFANRQIDSVYEWTRRNPGKMVLVKNPAELNKAIKEKKIAAMMGVEGGHMIENKIENLEALYARGVRYMTLTWNNSPGWATSAAYETSSKPNPDYGVFSDTVKKKGLTEFGKQVVKRMNELGMIVDVSHVGEQAFWEAINLSTKPIIASHSNAWTLCPHRRNLKDDQIKAIAKNGGVIHLNFFAGFIDSSFEKKSAAFDTRHKTEIDSLIQLGGQPNYAKFKIAEKYPEEINATRPPLSMLLDHLDYIVKLVGVDYVGMGSDFDGIEAPPQELNGVQDFPLITKALLQRGYSKKDINKIMGGNFLRVFKTNQEN